MKDATGAVLPGVTVEAASPAVIEKVRTALTDGEGEYKLVDLRPGTYTVTFELTGFSAVKREGIELTTGVTVNVTGEMLVGSLEGRIYQLDWRLTKNLKMRWVACSRSSTSAISSTTTRS